MLRRVWRASVWHPSALPHARWRERTRKRLWLPLYDAALMVGGIVAIVVGVPAFDEVLTEDIADAAGILLFLIGLICFIGIAFPHLWILEYVGKTGGLVVFLVYCGILIALAVQHGNGARDFVAVVAFLACIPPLDRLTELSQEWGDRIAERKARAALVPERPV